MTNKNILLKFKNNSLSPQASKRVKGGRNNNIIPVNTGSYGFINWDDIDVRNEGIVSSAGQSIGISLKKKLG